MSNLFASVSIVAAVALSAVVAQAMPFESDRIHGSLVVPVADGCGFNRYRDPRGCVGANTFWLIATEKRPLYGACGGLNSHRVCNLFGQCWMVCD
jgi:hypothetical protein